MKREIIINSIPSKTLAKTIIDNLEIDSPHVVNIRPHVKNRSDAMRRLYFLQVDAVAREIGEPLSHKLHGDLKWEFLAPIYIREKPGYGELYYSASTPEAISILTELTSLKKIENKLMVEYMDRVKWAALERYNFNVPIPEDLRWVAV
jgi:hypothetical protein